MRRTGNLIGKIIFVSHEWLGVSDSDPQGVHLSLPQRIFLWLLRGEVAKVETNFVQKFLNQSSSVDALLWKSFLPEKFVGSISVVFRNHAEGTGSQTQRTAMCSVIWQRR